MRQEYNRNLIYRFLYPFIGFYRFVGTVDKFAKKGFLRNLDIDTTFISYNTYLFEKAESMDLYDVINHYEKSIKIQKKIYSKPRVLINRLFDTKLRKLKPFIKKILKVMHIK